ncbi:MAG: hypothetical protein ACE15C_18835 [Phycisphaerae bacterium]
MVLSSRERYILVAAIVAVAVFVLWQLAVGPLLDHMDVTGNQIDKLSAEVNENAMLIANRASKDRKWREMAQNGMKADAAEAESQLMHALQDWAEEAGLPPLRLNPARATEKTLLPEITVQADGTGPLRGLHRILTKAESAKFPVRVTEVKIAARKEGADDLGFTLHVSTVYSPSKATPAPAASAASAPTGGRQ